MKAMISKPKERIKRIWAWICKELGQWFKPRLKRLREKWIDAILIAIGFAAFVWFLGWPTLMILLDTLDSLQNPKATDSSPDLRGLAFLVGGVLLGIPTLFLLGWRSLNIYRQTQTGQQGHMTDRINSAVANLGAEKTVKKDDKETTEPNIEVRIGGIYALERISQDSKRDHIRMMELLTAYIRENAPVSGAMPKPEGGWTQAPYKIKIPLPRADVQIAIDVLGRRAHIDHEKKQKYHLDLRVINLQRIDMREGNFARARLYNAQLQWAYLWRSDLQWADLRRAKLKWAELSEANLQKANLWRAKLQGANLSEANLQGAILWKTDLSKVKGLTQDQIDAAFGDASVIVPDGLQRPEHWPAEELDFDAYEKAYNEWLKSKE